MDMSKGVAIGSTLSSVTVEPKHCTTPESNEEEWIIVSKRDSKSRLLPRRMIFVGRQDCDICVPSTTVDMRHAVLFFNGQHFHIKDLNSAYGTYVNEKRIAGQCYIRLQHSDRIRFGFGPDLFIIEKISSMPLITSPNPQLNSYQMEIIPPIEPQSCDELIKEKNSENLSKENLSTLASRLITCENQSNSSLSNSIDSLDEIKSIKLLKDSNISDKKEELSEINEEMPKEGITSLMPSTPAPDSLGSVESYNSCTAFIIAFDDDNENKKKMNIKDSIRQFAPPKPDSIEKQRPKSARNESKVNENPFPKQKSPTNNSKRQSNAMSANKTTKILNKMEKTPTSAAINCESGGHLSDSATYLINRMLSNRTTDNVIQNSNLKSNTMTEMNPKTTFGDKTDSGLADDKSDSGNTYIVEEDIAVEKARKDIDQIFGVDDSATISLNSSPDSSLTLNSPTLLRNFEEKLSKNRQLMNSTKFENKTPSSDSEVRPQLMSNNSTFTRTKRRPLTVEEMLNKVESSDVTNRNLSKILSKNDFNPKESNSSHINHFPSKIENHNQLKTGISQSAPSTPRSPLISRKLVELRMNSRQNALNGRRKNSWNSDMDYYESYNSDESTDQSHRSSNSALSKDGGSISSPIPSKINFNRAFALRRARLGIETPGIDLNTNTNSNTTNKSGLSRNDGGRFSLRVAKKNINESSKKVVNRISSKDKPNISTNNSLQRKGSDPFGALKTNRQSFVTSVSDNERRTALNNNRFNQLNNNRFRYNNNNTNIPKNINRQNTFTDSELSVSQKSKQNGHQVIRQMNEFNSKNNRFDNNNINENMSSSLTEPSHKPPISNFQNKNKSGLELTALDSLVVSAINQLSHKIRGNLTEVMESQRLKHSTCSQARSMIDEILPQLSASDRRSNDNNISVSRDLSTILKNLKKIEQTIEVINHLLEPNSTTKTNSFRKQTNDFFVVDI